jgi:acyl-CoA thioester hydrolase
VRIHVQISLRWSDFDPYAHVNNAEMLRLLEEARIQAMWRHDEGIADPVPTAVMDVRPGAPVQALISRQEIEYLAPIPFMRAPIDIEMWAGAIGGASLDICYEVYSPIGVEPRQLYTKAATTVVTVATETGRPTRVPDEVRTAWTPYIEERVQFGKRR